MDQITSLRSFLPELQDSRKEQKTRGLLRGGRLQSCFPYGHMELIWAEIIHRSHFPLSQMISRAFWRDYKDFVLSSALSSDRVALPHGKRGKGGCSSWHSASCSAYLTVLLLGILDNDSLAEIFPSRLLYYQNSFFHYKKQFQYFF